MTSSSSSKRPSWIGQILGGRYRIDETLGQGGMSAVYKAYDPNLKRFVAVKLIHSHLADDAEFVARFEEEATAVAQLRHPHIVQVFDFNHDDNLYYMVQEFLAGETLYDQLRSYNESGRRLPMQDAIGYAIDICSAIGYAHKRGMIHRDIKPANIMLDLQGQAVLMDFGIVKITGGEQHTATGAVLGTALYMSPEMIRGEIPDARADMYSLGVTLFEMVSGRPPFEADSVMSLMMKHLNDPVPDLNQLRPEVPEDLIAVIEKALAKAPEDRFSTAEELAAALEQVRSRLQAGVAIETELVQAPPEPGATPTVRPVSSVGQRVSSTEIESVPERLSSPVMPSPPPSAMAAADPVPLIKRPIFWIGGVAAVFTIIIGCVFLAAVIGGNQDDAPTDTAQQTQTAQAMAVAQSTNESKDVVTQAATDNPSPTAGATMAPTIVPSPTIIPTATIPVGIPFSRINGITLSNQGYYIVNYETFEFTETLPGMHVHFFFNTVPQEQAGIPGQGPWILYGGPRPFGEYHKDDRPEDATHMCILVANADHSVQLESGNCMILPDVAVVVANVNMSCQVGPGDEYQESFLMPARGVLMVLGISPDEMWWQVPHPVNEGETCWLERGLTTFYGDISILPLAEPPPLPAEKRVTITGISIDGQNRYVVDYVTEGFVEELPGTHLHFYFNNVPAEDVGIGGSSDRIMHGGPAPFTRYSTSDRPQDATQLCVLVANPDHSIIQNSGNCSDLPDA